MSPKAPKFIRCTIVVAGAAAADATRVGLAREGRTGTSVTTIEGLAVRIAGGFLTGIDPDALHEAVASAINDLPEVDLGDLGTIAGLPGLPSALCATFAKSWAAGIDLQARSAEDGGARLLTLARIEEAALVRLPASSRRPTALVAAALERLAHAPAVLGAVEVRGIPDIDPCWRPLVTALARTTPVVWTAGPRDIPGWVLKTAVKVECGAAAEPRVSVASCASARHEVMEALRWARATLADGVPAADIAIAGAAPKEYDDLVLTLAAEANLDLHFAHGRRVLTTRDGQTCAALADLLLRGLDRDRMLRFVRASTGNGTALGSLPDGWRAFLGRNDLLDTPKRWRKALQTDEVPATVRTPLVEAVDLVARGLEAADEAGERLLRGPARLIWRRALMRAPASALEGSLADLRAADQVEPATAIAWMHAAALASAPRPHVWLLGLNSRSWPRRSREDPLLPDHVVPSAELQPRTVTEDDRASFAHILRTAAASVSCSYSRRDATGRLLGVSALVPDVTVHLLYRARTPEHAMSEPDRLMACPGEFAATRRATAADACWRDWHRPELTAHDGLIRRDHPAIAAALAREHSASSLKLLLRNPLGFVWRYGLGWSAPDQAAPSFDLDARTFGTLVHDVLKAAVTDLEGGQGLGEAPDGEIDAAVERAAASVAAAWVEVTALPPSSLWNGHLERAGDMASTALRWGLQPYPGQRSFVEIEFPAGGPGAPWTQTAEVAIPGTRLRIAGRIDRLDLSADGRSARVLDYKTGKPRAAVVLDGGTELQRCLYSFALQALLGPDVAIEAALLFPHDGEDGYQPLADHAGAMATLTAALVAADASLMAGAAVPGCDAGDGFDDFLFALPASPGSMLEMKKAAARDHLGAAAMIWEAS